VPGRFAAAKQAGATEDEIMEALYYAMRGAARATWSTIKYIEGIEDLNKAYKTTYEGENGK
jgi:alkylhydroperoxidase/carboxymuconolactone decarboxylase family protein YurZ